MHRRNQYRNHKRCKLKVESCQDKPCKRKRKKEKKNYQLKDIGNRFNALPELEDEELAGNEEEEIIKIIKQKIERNR